VGCGALLKRDSPQARREALPVRAVEQVRAARLDGAGRKWLRRELASARAAGRRRSNRTRRGSLPVALELVQEVSVLGCGAFGMVTLVKYCGDFYAMKTMHKGLYLERRAAVLARRERATMNMCCSPFVVRLHGTARDTGHIYMLMEPMMGGELYGYARTLGDVAGGASGRGAACLRWSTSPGCTSPTAT